MVLKLNQNCPVKWTATQEKSISRELSLVQDALPSSPAEYVCQTYSRFLWLPESIMPLDRLVPALLQVSAIWPHLVCNNTRSPLSSDPHPLHHLLRPYLLTTRAASDKYYKEIPNLLESEDADQPDHSDELMWFAWRNDKADHNDESQDEMNPAAADERWKKAWLVRMERREITMQILLHLLLLSLPGVREDQSKTAPPAVIVIEAPSPSPRKRRRNSVGDGGELTNQLLKERLERLMDKVAMWQLMGSIDNTAGGDDSLRKSYRMNVSTKAKPTTADERDWMQVFCEDIVEPVFSSQLAAQCALLRSKVFRSSPFDDDPDTAELLATPPASPEPSRADLPAAEPLPRAVSRGASIRNQLAQRPKTLARSGSLSASLEEERMRQKSRSLSIGPAKATKRALSREVSMTTSFKGRTNAKINAKPTKQNALSKTKSSADLSLASSKARTRIGTKGTTLVAATPVKSKIKPGHFRGPGVSEERDVLPVIIDDSLLRESARAMEGDEDDDNWVIQSSPDVLLLTDDDQASPSPLKRRLSVNRGMPLPVTPTKTKRAKSQA